MFNRLSVFVCCLASAVLIAGCQSDSDDSDKKDKEMKKNGGDSHGHHHAPHGPRGGHIAVFKSADGKEIHVEHVEKDSADLVEFYTVENKEKNYDLRPLKIEKFTVVSNKGSKEQSFELKPVEAAEGMASKFEEIDKNLIIAMDLGVEASFELDGVEYKATIHPSGH